MSIIMAFVLGFLLRGTINNNEQHHTTVTHVTPAKFERPAPLGVQAKQR